MPKRNYRVSDDTKRNLIEAAGELFSRHGTEAVTVRDITNLAGTKPNAISYHFGGKDGLIDAVWEFALQRWKDSPLERFCQENASLFETRDGKRQIVVDLIDLYYQTLYANDLPLWVTMFLLRTLITGQNLEMTRNMFGHQLLDVFCNVFQRITGNDDRTSGICWALNIVSPGATIAASAVNPVTYTSTRKVDYTFCRRLQAFVTRNALYAIGLQEP